MSLVVEDGTGLAGAESYVSGSACQAYAMARGLDFFDGAQAEMALRRATRYIDATYRARFSGYPLQFGVQSLEWPRVGAYWQIANYDGAEAFAFRAGGYVYRGGGLYYFQSNVIPQQIKDATCEAAIREYAKPGILAPDLKRGNAIQSITAGPVSITYAANASAMTTFQAIDQALASLLVASSVLGGRAVRG